jgi:hypothetical protein
MQKGRKRKKKERKKKSTNKQYNTIQYNTIQYKKKKRYMLKFNFSISHNDEWSPRPLGLTRISQQSACSMYSFIHCRFFLYQFGVPRKKYGGEENSERGWERERTKEGVSGRGGRSVPYMQIMKSDVAVSSTGDKLTIRHFTPAERNSCKKPANPVYKMEPTPIEIINSWQSVFLAILICFHRISVALFFIYTWDARTKNH